VSAPAPRAGWPRWPQGFEPANCPVFVANEHEVAAPPEVPWKCLCRAETKRGPLPWWLRWYLRSALHGAHQEWLESLERVVKNGPPKS